jgi:hypothetical protein
MRRLLIIPVLGLLLSLSSLAQAVNWGSLKDDGCRSTGFRQFSAILWNIPHGSNWEATCASAPVLDWGAPTRCKNTGLNMWGEWDRADPECK